MNIHAIITKQIKESKYKQSEIAEKCGISLYNLRDYIYKGTHNVELIEKLLVFFELKIVKIFKG